MKIRYNESKLIKSWENFASFRGKRSILLNLVFLFLLTQIPFTALSWKVSWVLKYLRNLVSTWESLSLLMVETSVHMTSSLKKSVTSLPAGKHGLSPWLADALSSMQSLLQYLRTSCNVVCFQVIFRRKWIKLNEISFGVTL